MTLGSPPIVDSDSVMSRNLRVTTPDFPYIGLQRYDLRCLRDVCMSPIYLFDTQGENDK